MAVGTVRGYQLGGTVYIDPGDSDTPIEPLLPWGRASRRFNLSADLNRGSPYPHVMHTPTNAHHPPSYRQVDRPNK